MLPATVDTLIRESIDVYLKSQGFRPPRFGQRLLARSIGGEVIQPAKVAAVTSEEIETVATGLVKCIQKVIEKVQITPAGGTVTFKSDIGKSYRVWSRSDLSPATSWQVIGTITATDVTTDFSDRRVGQDFQFYRIELLR